MCRKLRPHQREGVQFLYERVSSPASSNHCGAILADEMGLGKTLQIITLVWTLLKQGPQGRPSLRKVLVVTPSSLTLNWAAEIKKWLGTERLKAMVLQAGSEAPQQVSDWKFGTIWNVMIASYESIRKYCSQLAGTAGLLICDEGHRLKTAQGNKTIDALLKLCCQRRIILTGTPVQNNLDEFYAMMEFVNPGLLGSLASFKRIFEAPITKGRDRNATAEEQQLGKARTRELGKMIDTVVLQRTSEVNQRYLPCLSTFVLFCRPSPFQITLYKEVLKSKTVASLLGSSDTKEGVLHIITMLKKLCNHPDLLRLKDADEEQGTINGPSDEGFHALFPQSYKLQDPSQSGKLGCLSALLQGIITGTHDRAVVVASSTAALDIVQSMCHEQGLTTCRIDGATPPAKRQDIIDAFNHHRVGQVCLLSTTAGGAGLNLTGANHLVLYDAHWNPAMDAQAMARIWRDGQLKPCTIYRLLLTGTIDEKITNGSCRREGLLP
ncbi:hypothetical protein WJX84_006451 [Apatococcus fuscideae]|uniref:Uncharacterized protein n=1 Tax=Apatococcus fuscideae TaxID=2026836 RepID=A0AAW1SNQ3_9CHLO